MRSGKWYTFKEAFGIFNQHHKEALKQYIENNKIVSDDSKMNEYTMEGYIFNRLKNHFQLKNKNIKEIDLIKLNKLIDSLAIQYKREKHRYHPDGSASLGVYAIPTKNNNANISAEIVVYFSLGEDSPAFATYFPDTHRNCIILAPCFFESMDRETQLFVLYK